MDGEGKKQQKRSVEKWVVSRWIPIFSLRKLKNGDIFRMFEPDGTPVKDKEGNTRWIVTKEIYPDEPEGAPIFCKEIGAEKAAAINLSE